MVFDAVGYWDNLEWISFEMIVIEVEDSFEEFSLLAKTRIVRNMIGDFFRSVNIRLWENVPILNDKILDCKSINI